MAENSVTIRIGADATDLQRGLRQSTAAVNTFGTKTRATIARVSGSIRGIADRMVTPFTALAMGGGLGYAVKRVGDLSESLMYYGMAAKKSDADTKVFRESLHKMAVETGVNANEILNGISRIGEITGDFAFSENMGEVLAKTSKAANVSMDDLALLASAINANVGWGAQKISEYFNSLIIQGDQGSFTLQKFAQEGKALFSSAAAFGIQSKEQFAYFGAMLQTIAPSIKSEAEITTSVAALFRDLKDKQKDLGKKGIKIFDVVDGKNQVRDFKSIIDDIMAYVDGDAKKLAEIGLTSESMKVLNPLMADYQNQWQKMKAITDSGMAGMTNTKELDSRFAKTANQFKTNVAKMQAVAQQFADEQLSTPVEKLTDALKYLSDHQGLVTAGFQAMKVAAVALAAVKIGGFVKQIGSLASDLKGIWSRKGGGAAASTGVPGDPSVQKVFVVNMGSGWGDPYMIDDDYRPSQNSPTQQAAKATATATKEVGRFGQGLAKARAGLNRLGNSPLAMGVMGAATGWAMDQIYNFGSAFLEWRRTVEAVGNDSKAMLDANDASFEARYGSDAAKWSKKHSETLLAIQSEENSFIPSQKKLDKLYGDLRLYGQLTKNAVANSDGNNGMSAQEYMQNMTVAPNIVINMDVANNRFTAQSDGGKPANVKTNRKNTPSFG